jgi:hypothetical protein
MRPGSLGAVRRRGELPSLLTTKIRGARHLRGYGRDLSGHAAVACSRGFSVGSNSKAFGAMRSGTLYRIPLPFAGECEVTASLSGFGRIRLEILG